MMATSTRKPYHDRRLTDLVDLLANLKTRRAKLAYPASFAPYFTSFSGVPKRFELGYWNTNDTACAAGYAGLDPIFKRQGFRADPFDGVIYDTRSAGVYVGLEACKVFFGLTNPQTLYIFTNESWSFRGNSRPSEIIRRVRAVLGGYAAE